MTRDSTSPLRLDKFDMMPFSKQSWKSALNKHVGIQTNPMRAECKRQRTYGNKKSDNRKMKIIGRLGGGINKSTFIARRNAFEIFKRGS